MGYNEFQAMSLRQKSRCLRCSIRKVLILGERRHKNLRKPEIFVR